MYVEDVQIEMYVEDVQIEMYVEDVQLTFRHLVNCREYMPQHAGHATTGIQWIPMNECHRMQIMPPGASLDPCAMYECCLH